MKIAERTKYVYIITSSNALEVRFIQDIAHCALFLTFNKGVKSEDQVVVTDIPKENLVNTLNFFERFEVLPSSEIYDYIKDVDYDNLFVITSCHGSMYGIDAKKTIRPYHITEAIKQNPHLTNCVALFGQCYAGIFNHLDIGCQGKKIVYIGATEMRVGLSVPLSWDLAKDNTWRWSANIFVYHLADWLNNPVDVDGDGLFTVADLYKYICYKTNQETENIEKSEAKRYLDEKIKDEIGKVVPADADTKDELENLDAEAAKELDYMVPHQDCWILNAESAIKMIIEF